MSTPASAAPAAPVSVARASGGSRPGAEIAYRVGNGLYLNVTNRCTARCDFCPRQEDYQYKGLDLRVGRDPTAAELIAAAGDPTKYDEIVFCGFGEPTIRLAALSKVADHLRASGARRVRLNTNGHGNLVHKRNILPDLAGRIDAVSISLNSADPKQYGVIMRLGRRGPRYFAATVEFARLALQYIPEVTVSVVDLPEVDVERARRLVEGIGARFRVRPLF